MYKSHYGFGLNRDDDNDIAVSRGFSKILRYCLIEAKEKNSVYLDEILKAFTEVTENAPEFEIGRFFAYPMLAGAITVAKKTEHLWNTIREDIRVKLELIMELFLYIGAHATHSLNNYKTGFKNQGGWNKHWNPNHKFATKGLMCYVLEYYNDIETIDAKLDAFNFDDVITRIQEAGFTRCYNLWTAPAEQLDEDLYTQTVRERFETVSECFIKDIYGNVYSGGFGTDIWTRYYMFSKNDPSITAEVLIAYLIADCYPAIPCESKIDVEKDGVMDAYILDGTTSPLEGQIGMFREFKCGSGAGVNRRFRSSLWYCMEDYIQASALLAYYNMFIANFAEEHSSIYPRVKVGNADLMYKIEHGYVGQANGRYEKTYPNYGFKNNSEALAWKETLDILA